MAKVGYRFALGGLADLGDSVASPLATGRSVGTLQLPGCVARDHAVPALATAS